MEASVVICAIDIRREAAVYTHVVMIVVIRYNMLASRVDRVELSPTTSVSKPRKGLVLSTLSMVYSCIDNNFATRISIALLPDYEGHHRDTIGFECSYTLNKALLYGYTGLVSTLGLDRPGCNFGRAFGYVVHQQRVLEDSTDEDASCLSRN